MTNVYCVNSPKRFKSRKLKDVGQGARHVTPLILDSSDLPTAINGHHDTIDGVINIYFHLYFLCQFLSGILILSLMFLLCVCYFHSSICLNYKQFYFQNNQHITYDLWGAYQLHIIYFFGIGQSQKFIHCTYPHQVWTLDLLLPRGEGYPLGESF